MKQSQILFYTIILGVGIYFSSCVPARQYQDAVAARDKCTQDTAMMSKMVKDKEIEIADLNKQLLAAQDRITHIAKDSSDIAYRYAATVKANEDLRQIEDQLNNRINQLLALSSNENQQLREDLQKKEDELNAKEKELNGKQGQLTEQQKNIDKLTADLADREKRVNELEDILGKQQQIVTDLKNKIDQALSSFSSTELTVERKNGKVYVSLSEKLLFASGSTVVDPKGKDALKKLADVLKNNADIQIEIEGHTDNVPLKSASFPKDNWDLSVLRATSIVKILTVDNGVDAKRVTASGRGEYFPIASNDNTEGKAKNRRTEIILSPNLDSLYNLLDQK